MAATRLDIRTRARIRADQDGGRFPTDVAYNLYIDEACKDVFADLIMSGWPPDFSTTTLAYTGSAAGQAIGGGADVFSVIGVWADVGGERAEVSRMNEGDRAQYTSGSASGAYPEVYDLRVGSSGPVLYLFPRVAATVYVDFVPDHTGLANDAAVWRGPVRSDELVVLSAARKGVLKEGEARMASAARLKEEYDEMLAKVKSLASWYDQRNPAMMRVASGRTRFNAFDYNAAGPGSDF